MNDEPKIELTRRTLPGVDWSSDNLFYTHSWREETSQFDNHPSVRWEGGVEYYSRELKARVPIAFLNCEELVQEFLVIMMDNFADVEGFWVS